jgi:chemotaxis protein CheD
MADAVSTEPKVFLQPGELFMSETPVKVKTVLGSCVAIVMRAPRRGLAAISHCMLPEAADTGRVLSRAEALRYVDATVEIMLRGFSTRGIGCAELEIKLFGGAQQVAAGAYRIGSKNVEAARTALARHGLSVTECVTGGSQGRVIEVDTATGLVMVKRLS